jgi:hypothetical protein
LCRYTAALSMFPDPVNQPRFVRELLLEGCHEVLRRAGFGGEQITTAAAATAADSSVLTRAHLIHNSKSAPQSATSLDIVENVNTAEYGLLAVGGTLPASAEVTAVDDAIHGNEDYIQMVDPNRLGRGAVQAESSLPIA